jgi:hypothetical protein
MSQRKIAEFIGSSIRTVQRGVHDGKEHGLCNTAFGKPREVPPGAKGPLFCKFSHRWTIGRGLVGDALHAAIDKARMVCVITKAAIRRTFNAPQAQPTKVRTKPRKPPDHFTREQKEQWLEEQIAREPSTSEVVQRDAEPPDR